MPTRAARSRLHDRRAVASSTARGATGRRAGTRPAPAVADAAIARHLPYARLADPATVATKDGALLRVFQIDGFPFETADADALDHLKHGRNLLLRALADARTGLYCHVRRRRTTVRHEADFDVPFAAALNADYNRALAARELYTNTLTLTLIVRPTTLQAATARWGRSPFRIRPPAARRTPGGRTPTGHPPPSGADEARRAQWAALEAKSALIGKALAEYGVRRLGPVAPDAPLGRSELLEFLFELINGTPGRVAPPREGLDAYLGARRLVFEREAVHLRGATRDQERFGAIVALKEYQPETAAGALDHLLALPCEFTLTQSFACWSRKAAIDRLRACARRYRQAEDSATLEDQIQDAVDAVQVGGVAFGQHHLSVLVTTRDPDALDAAVDDVIEAFGRVGAIAVREDINLEAAYWAQLPANFAYIAREAGLSSLNFAGLASLHNAPIGANRNHWGAPVTWLETVSGTPYAFGFHVGSVGHFTLTGPSGSGKTVLLNFLLAQAQKFRPRAVVLDKDEGTLLAVRALGGTYATLRPGAPTGFNPLAWPDGPDTRAFQARWIAALAGRALNPSEAAILQTAITVNADAPPEARCLRHFAELLTGYDREGALADALRPWHGDGAHAWVFDNAEDLYPDDAALAGFDLTAVLDDARVRAPVLLYLIERIDRSLDGRRTLIFIDEGWKALADPVLAERIRDWLKTLRKQNGVLGLGTQEVGDILASPIADTLIEQCPTQIVLPNYKARREQYRTAFGLTDGEFAVVRTAPPGARHFLIKQGRTSAVARLDLSDLPDRLAILSGTAQLNRFARRLWAEHGNDPQDWLGPFQVGWRAHAE